MARWFKAETGVQVGTVSVSVSTPDWTIENPAHYPGWLPKASLRRYAWPVECRRMLMVDWFFHLCVCWGRNDPPPDGEE